MADGAKTRPTNNFHCFTGYGFTYWYDKASGLQPKPDTRPTPDGHVFDYEPDADGYAMNNGGILQPAEVTLSLRPLFRFFDSSKKPSDAIGGNWWLRLQSLSSLMDYAYFNDVTLARAAQLMLIIPKNWGDCTNLIFAKPTTVLKAFEGQGNSVAITASGKGTSPNAKRSPGTTVYAGVSGNKLQQIYIPGDAKTDAKPAFLDQFMQKISVHHIDRRGNLHKPIPLNAGGS